MSQDVSQPAPKGGALDNTIDALKLWKVLLDFNSSAEIQVMFSQIMQKSRFLIHEELFTGSGTSR